MAETPAFEIQDGVLVGYHGCEETVVVPKGVTGIGRAAFQGNKTMRHIRLPDTVTEIRFHAFADCECLEEADIPGSVRVIAAHAFMRCGNLHSVTLHEGLQEIGTWAFGDCPHLTSIAIPDTVQEIGRYALGFRQASYEDRYVRGMSHSFYSGFHIHHNGNAATIQYIAFHKLSIRLVRG